MSETTPRFALPLLQAGQAQKEIDHNEALVLIDGALQPLAQTVGDDAAPSSPALGATWIVGAAPTGDWSGQPHALALWTGGGWRFQAPTPGMTVWNDAGRRPARWDGSAWLDGDIAGALLRIDGVQVVAAQQAAVADPTGGTTIDTQARSALGALLTALRTHGLIAS